MSLPIVAKISLVNLIENAKNIKNFLKEGSKFCAVVKSDGYGHGIVEVSSAIYSYVDAFAVSLVSECEALRIAGIDKPIMILTPPFKESVYKLIKYDTIIPVSTFEEIKLVYESAKKLKRVAKIQIAINSGMNRLGFSTLKEIKTAVYYVKSLKNLNLVGAYSHFGDTCNKEYTERQFKKFNKLIKPIKDVYPNVDYHISASGGMLADEKYHLSMCRVGLLLYGYKPFMTNKIQVKPVMEVLAKRIIVRNKLKGKNLLYGSNLSSVNTATILRVGYADGFFREGLESSLNSLCMDLSAISGKVDKEYHLIMQDAEILAKKWGTIPYEVLVNATKRADRIYIK